jgi:hypothetical protein
MIAVQWLAQHQSDDLADRRFGAPLNGPAPASVKWRPDHEVFPELKIFPATATDAPLA